jgi:aminopeptidase N
LAAAPVLDRADYELARTWFGWHVRPRAEADLLLGRGMALFAALHAAEAQGGAAGRQQEIVRLIATYDDMGPAADDKPGFGPVLGYSRTEQTAKSYKAALFLLSLEDIAGEEKFHRAVRRILTDMAGQEIGSDELRSAVESEAGRNLAAVFHAWLDHSGLPADFRARYALR